MLLVRRLRSPDRQRPHERRWLSAMSSVRSLRPHQKYAWVLLFVSSALFLLTSVFFIHSFFVMPYVAKYGRPLPCSGGESFDRDLDARHLSRHRNRAARRRGLRYEHRCSQLQKGRAMGLVRTLVSARRFSRLHREPGRIGQQRRPSQRAFHRLPARAAPAVQTVLAKEQIIAMKVTAPSTEIPLQARNIQRWR